MSPTIPIPTDFTGTLTGQGGAGQVRRSVLPGGVRVLTESMPEQRSVTIGFWIAVGSRDESPEGYGSTHFLEHLLFKGTDQRSAMDIATAFDRVGGESNAATAKESTCYHAHILDTDLPMAIDVITDMVTSALLDETEMEVERGVILEELAMAADDPSDVAHEALAAKVLDGHALSRPIGGTPETIRAVTREQVLEHYRRWYRPDELVITAAGGLDHDEVCRLVLEALQRSGWELPDDAAPVQRRSHLPARAEVLEGVHHLVRPVEQASVLVGGRSLNSMDPDRFALSVMNTVLGGGMSSRLFQEIREKRGLAYATYSFSAAHSDVGYFGLFAGCTPDRAEQVAAMMTDELERIAQDGITPEELDRARGQLSGGTVLALEDTGSRMARLGRAELVTGEFTDLDGSLARIRAVTSDQVRDVAGRLAASRRATVIVGPQM